MAEPGTIFTASTAKKYLWDNKGYVQPENPFYGVTNYGGNFWQDTYQNIAENERALVGAYDFNRQKAIAGYQGDFYDAALAAYKSSLGERANIMKSGLGQGYKEKLYDDLDAQLNSAYDQYMSIYKSNTDSANQTALQGQMSAIESANKARTNLLDTMTNEATNMSDYLNAHFDYLGAIYDKYEKEGNLDYFLSEQWRPYVDTEIIGGKDTVVGLKNINDIKAELFKDGELTDAGRDYIKFVQSQTEYDFGDYLASYNKDLYNWAVSPNAYNSPYLDTANVNTNRAAALASIGLYDTEIDEDGNEKYIVNTKFTPKNDTANIESKYLIDSYLNTKDFGTVKKYDYNGNTISEFEGLSASGIKEKDGNNFTLRWRDGSTERVYRLQFAKGDDGGIIDSGEILNNIDKAVGGIENEKLYHYFDGKEDKVYMGFVGKDGNRSLREVIGRTGNDSFDVLIKTIKNENELRKIAGINPSKRYSTYEDEYMDAINRNAGGAELRQIMEKWGMAPSSSKVFKPNKGRIELVK